MISDKEWLRLHDPKTYLLAVYIEKLVARERYKLWPAIAKKREKHGQSSGASRMLAEHSLASAPG